jgi:hypothetical protein
VYNPLSGESSRSLEVEGILYHAVDHLPSECAKCVLCAVHVWGAWRRGACVCVCVCVCAVLE